MLRSAFFQGSSMLQRGVMFVCLLAAAVAGGCANHSMPKATDEHGFKPLFNGHDLTGWSYEKQLDKSESKAGVGYQVREDGVVYCTANDGGVLMTDEQYDDLVLRFEYKLVPNANNGIGIRTPEGGNPSYRGMEIQILDDTGPKYHAPNREIRPAQYNGSIYDVVPAEQGHLKPVGEWNSEEIIANGSHIKVTLNGATIVDTDLKSITDEHVLAKHPGVRNKTGHIALLGHGAEVEFRNMRVKSL
jgi:hypothetical protein